MAETRETKAQTSQPNTRINPIVFFGSSVCILAIALWAIISPEGANSGWRRSWSRGGDRS
jgi:choline/glycine/proline betaine transport protein